MEPGVTPKTPRWPRLLALLFIIFYALFWSLGPFFSTTLLALAGYFSFLSLYTSVELREWIKNLVSSIRPPAGPRFAPRQNYQPRPEQAETDRSPAEPPLEPAAVIKKVFRFIRFIIIGVMSVIFILFLIGIFLPEEEQTNPEESETVSADGSETVSTGGSEPVSQAEYFTEKGNTAANNKLTDSAHYYYDQALVIEPDNVYALYNKGLAYVLANDFNRGNSLTRRCLSYHPDYDQAWWLLGYSYDQLNNTDSALYCLEIAKGHDFAESGFLELLGEVYEKKGRQSDALEAYQKLVSIDTTKADVWRKLAVLDPEHASEYLRKADALNK